MVVVAAAAREGKADGETTAGMESDTDAAGTTADNDDTKRVGQPHSTPEGHSLMTTTTGKKKGTVAVVVVSNVSCKKLHVSKSIKQNATKP